MTNVTVETSLPPDQWPDLDRLRRFLITVLRDPHVRVHIIRRHEGEDD